MLNCSRILRSPWCLFKRSGPIASNNSKFGRLVAALLLSIVAACNAQDPSDEAATVSAVEQQSNEGTAAAVEETTSALVEDAAAVVDDAADGASEMSLAEQEPPDALWLSQQAANDPLVARILKPSVDDIDPSAKGHLIRVLVSYNNTNYFLVRGQQKGLEYELMQRFEEFLSERLGESKKDVHLVFVSVPFDQLIPSLLAGYGDIAAAGLTITRARSEQVTFTQPYRRNVAEVVVRHRTAAAINDVEDLAGKTVYALAGSSYIDHLQQLNQRLLDQGLTAIDVQPGDQTLQSEDLLQMVNAGVYDYMVVDNHIADLWASVLPDIIVEDGAQLAAGRNIAWAVRQNNPVLEDKLNEFVAEHKQGTLLGNIFFKRYYGGVKWITNPLSPEVREQLDTYIAYFKKYGEQYDMPWLKIGALAFQESGLDQNARSGAGAVGVMQIKPSTAADKNVGILDVESSAENNIHAGVKYLAFLRNRYFSDPEMSPQAQIDFTFAAYNAGPARVRRMRDKAREAGLNPNEWFFNVEHIARREIGRETVEYVANINKYYVAFNSILKQATP